MGETKEQNAFRPNTPERGKLGCKSWSTARKRGGSGLWRKGAAERMRASPETHRNRGASFELFCAVSPAQWTRNTDRQRVHKGGREFEKEKKSISCISCEEGFILSGVRRFCAQVVENLVSFHRRWQDDWQTHRVQSLPSIAGRVNVKADKIRKHISPVESRMNFISGNNPTPPGKRKPNQLYKIIRREIAAQAPLVLPISFQ